MHFVQNIKQNLHQKYFQNASQSDPKWFLFGAWEPLWNHDATRTPNWGLILRFKAPKRDPLGTPWAPWGPTNPQSSRKNPLKEQIQKHNAKKSRSSVPPYLKKYGFTIVKHTFSKIHLIPKKSQKWPKNAPQMAPKSTQGPPKGPPGPPERRTENQHKKKQLKSQKNKSASLPQFSIFYDLWPLGLPPL